MADDQTLCVCTTPWLLVLKELRGVDRNGGWLRIKNSRATASPTATVRVPGQECPWLLNALAFFFYGMLATRFSKSAAKVPGAILCSR